MKIPELRERQTYTGRKKRTYLGGKSYWAETNWGSWHYCHDPSEEFERDENGELMPKPSEEPDI